LLARLPDHVDDARNLIADVAGRLGQLERRARVDAEIAVASAQFYFGDIEAALHTNHDALATAKTLNDPRELARTTNNYGLLLYQVFDRRIEDLFDTHRETVEKTGAWRFAHVSHWLPAEYYVWQADVVKARASQALQRAAFSNEESEALRLRSLRRHTELLCNLIEGNFSPIVRDLQELGLPRDLDSAYAIIGPSAIASGLNSDTVGSAQLLQKAKAIRESLTPFQFGAVRSAVVIEIIALGVIGRWPEARRLFERIKGTAPNLASLDVALGLLCDGPPFVGVAEALGPCRGRPFMGLAALLIDRLLERAPVSEGAPRLTLAELEVLRLLGLGKPNKEIAAARSRSLDTVKRQVASIYHKLGVENRTAAVAVARTRGLL
jgi:DNA-binding CsgD family transcriptional regulator